MELMIASRSWLERRPVSPSSTRLRATPSPRCPHASGEGGGRRVAGRDHAEGAAGAPARAKGRLQPPSPDSGILSHPGAQQRSCRFREQHM